MFLPGRLMQGSHIIPVYKTVHGFGIQMVKNFFQTVVFPLIAGAIQFKILKEQQKLFEMFHGQALVYRIKRVRYNTQYLLIIKKTGQIKNIGADVLDLPVLVFVDIQSQDMDFAAGLRKIGGNLFADEGIGQVRNFQGAGNRIMIRDGHMGHAALFSPLIDLQRLGKAFRAAYFF
jgi:hypothetical protein